MERARYGNKRGGGGGRSGLRRLLPALLVLLLLAGLVYMLVPIGAQRAVLLGSDAEVDGTARSDTIIVVSADGGLLAVPRDTLVEIPAVGDDKVNAALAYGGPELTVETLEGFTGLPIDNYVTVDFSGVEEIVDAIGGVRIEVEEPIAYQLAGRYVYIPSGEQDLDGAAALAYVRYRGGPTADIGRIERQQRFLAALAREARSPANLPRLQETLGAVLDNTETNMNPFEAARFAVQRWLWGGSGPVETYPGTPQYIDGISYWVPDREAGERVVGETIG